MQCVVTTATQNYVGGEDRQKHVTLPTSDQS